MALHGGQANLTKDEYSQMNQSMPSRSWSQFGTGASGSGSSGSGSSASSTQAVATPSSACSKAICDAPCETELGKCGAWHQRSQRGSGATGQRLSKTGCQNPWQERATNQWYFEGCPHWASKTVCMLGQCFHCQLFHYFRIFLIADMLLFHKFGPWPIHYLPSDRLIQSKCQRKTCYLVKISEVNPCICQLRK